MLPADLVGKTVKHVMVHDVKPMYLGSGTVLQSFGAVDIWSEDSAVVLRSTLRYSQPRLSTVAAERLSNAATVTVCSREEADWLSGRLGRHWEPKPMRGQTIAAFNPTGPEICLRSADGLNIWIAYRADLDGSWFITQTKEPFDVGSISLEGGNDAFGWLLPEAPYTLHWDGRPWQTLATAWSCIDKPSLSHDRDRTFRRLYAIRLLQHPSLLRRFAALQYGVECLTNPWLAIQMATLQAEVLSKTGGFAPTG